MRDTMPDQDITLGEVYRAVLSLRDEFVQTRKDISEGHTLLNNEQRAQGLKIKELEIKNQVLENELLALKQAEPGKNSDPWARIGAALSGVGGLIYWYVHNKGGG